MRQNRLFISLMFVGLIFFYQPLSGLNQKKGMSLSEDSARLINRENETVFSEEDWRKAVNGMNFDEKTEKQEKPEEPAKESKVNKKKGKSNPWNINQQAIWLVLIAVLLAVLLIFVMRSRANTINKKAAVMVDPDEIDESNIHEQDFESMITGALAAGNYGLAFRYRYLDLLRSLYSRNLIFYKKEKTNFHYLMELGDTNYHEKFRIVTVQFDQVWYGEVPLTIERWQALNELALELKSNIEAR